MMNGGVARFGMWNGFYYVGQVLMGQLRALGIYCSRVSDLRIVLLFCDQFRRFYGLEFEFTEVIEEFEERLGLGVRKPISMAD
jgi:hypothetical protein